LRQVSIAIDDLRLVSGIHRWEGAIL